MTTSLLNLGFACFLIVLVAFPPSVLGKKTNTGSVRRLQDKSLADVILASDGLTKFAKALKAAGLLDELDKDSMAVFAPTNDAFDNAGIDFLLDPAWILHLQAVLLYHMTEGVFLSGQLAEGDKIVSLNQQEVINVTSMDPFTVNDAVVLRPNIAATNGVLHVVDQVLLPEFTGLSVVDLAAGMPETFSTFVELLDLANLTAVLRDDNEAFTGRSCLREE